VNGITGGLTSFNITGITVTSGTWTAQTMQLYVQDGTYYIAGTRYLFAGGSTPTVTAPTSHPRIDVLTINSSGALAWTVGTESATPSAPAYPTATVAICELYNVVGETGLYDNENQQNGHGYIYNDVRPIIGTPYGEFIVDPGGEAQGDLLYYNGSSWVRLAAGTSGFFLKTNGGSANPAWGQPSTQLYSTATAVNVSSGTTSEQTMISFSLSGGVLGTSGVVKGKLQFSAFPLTATGTSSKVVRVYYGSTAIASSNIFDTSGTSLGSAVVEFEIIANGATNSQLLTVRIIVNLNGSVSTNTTVIQMASGSAAIDSTTSQTVKVTTQDSGTTGNTQTMIGGYAFS
jgi:hypothetical protein